MLMFKQGSMLYSGDLQFYFGALAHGSHPDQALLAHLCIGMIVKKFLLGLGFALVGGAVSVVHITVTEVLALPVRVRKRLVFGSGGKHNNERRKSKRQKLRARRRNQGDTETETGDLTWTS